MDALGFARALRSPLAELPAELELVPLPGPFDVEIRPPGSKSLTNRALLLAALAAGESTLTGALLEADDARVMIDALRSLGVTIEVLDADAGIVRVVGRSGRLRGNQRLNLKNAGTATRFLTAAACLADAPVVIDGNDRMRRRPIGELARMLRELGARVEELGAPGCVPLTVHPIGSALTRPELRVGRTASSQFVSALLMIGPLLPGGLRVRFIEAPTSESYIEMTLAMMKQWLGRDIEVSPREGVGVGAVTLTPGEYRGRECAIEPDASGATYFWGAEAVVKGSRCSVAIDPAASAQADARCGAVFAAMRRSYGGLRGGEFDFTRTPDAAMTLAAVACFAEGMTTIRGLRTLRVKETDRLEALRHELTKVGAAVEIFSYAREDGSADEGLRLTPPPRARGGIDCSAQAPRVVFETYDDHRMAMSLAVFGLRRPNVVIHDPGCVAKTYPTFWRDWAALYESAARGGARVGTGSASGK